MSFLSAILFQGQNQRIGRDSGHRLRIRASGTSIKPASGGGGRLNGMD